MHIQASFISDSVKVVTEKCSLVFSLGYITYNIAADDWRDLDNVIDGADKQKLKKFALDMLERCFSTKDNEAKVNAFFQCEADLAMKYSYSLSASHPIVTPDGGIDYVDSYVLNSVESLILLEMMFSIKYNRPIVKCPNCKRFFIASNTGIQYCDRIFKDGKTCRQLGAKKLFSDKLKSDELLSAYEKKYQALYHKQKRTTDETEKLALADKLSTLKDLRMKYKKSLISPEEFMKALE